MNEKNKEKFRETKKIIYSLLLTSIVFFVIVYGQSLFNAGSHLLGYSYAIPGAFVIYSLFLNYFKKGNSK